MLLTRNRDGGELKENDYLESFRFTRESGRVYNGLLQPIKVGNNADLDRFHFDYWLRHAVEENQKHCVLDFTHICTLVRGFRKDYIPLYVMRVMRKHDFDIQKFGVGSTTLGEYTQIEDADTEEAHARIGRELLLLFTEDASDSVADLEIAYSTGYDKSIVRRSIDYYIAMGIIKRHGLQFESDLEKGGLQSLRDLVSPDSGGVAGVSKYFQKCDISRHVSKPFVFVLMPFKEEQCPQEFFSQVVRDHVSEQFGVQMYRADDDRLTRPGMAKINEYIRQSELTIAELTSVNPNVMYELGIAHAREKETVIFTQDTKKLPFDLRHLTVIEYSMDCLLDKWDEALREHFGKR